MPAPSYVHGASPVALLGETIGENLRRTVAQFGDCEALVVRHQQYRATYAELWDQTTSAARGLLARGIRKGDRVGIWAPNRAEWVVLQYATARIGAILVNINPAYKTAELAYVLQQSGATMLLLARAFRTSDYVGMLAEVRDRCPDLQQSIVLDDDWDALLADARKTPLDDLAALENSLQFDEAINIQYTSGTTGLSQGRHAVAPQHPEQRLLHRRSPALPPRSDRVCIPVPFYHCFGMVLGNLACTTHGVCMVIPGESYDPLAVMETVQAERCTALYGVPTMFIGELDHPRFAEFDFSSLRTGIMAGSPCPVEVMRKGPVADAHARGHHLLRDDRNGPGLDPEQHRRSARKTRLDRRPHPPARRDQDCRSGDGRDRAARPDRANCVPAATA